MIINIFAILNDYNNPNLFGLNTIIKNEKKTDTNLPFITH